MLNYAYNMQTSGAQPQISESQSQQFLIPTRVQICKMDPGMLDRTTLATNSITS